MHTHIRRLLRVVAIALVVVWCVQYGAGVEKAFAQNPGGFVFPQGMDSHIANIVSRLITVLNLMTWIVFVFLNYLLDPVFIFDLGPEGQDGALMDMLNQIWILSRDLMNICFALVLIGAAVYTIATAKKEFLSEYAPKFILAVVLVNFSWFFPRVIIDVANVGAAAVYGIPSYVQGPAAACSYESTRPAPNCQQVAADKFRCACMMVTDAQFFLTPNEVTNLEKAQYKCYLKTLLCVREEVMTPNNIAGYSAVLNGLIVNHGRLRQLAQVPNPLPGNNVNQMMTFLMREMLVLVIHIALLFPLLAMLVAFVIRIPVLWFTMAFMPFIFLDMVGGEKFTQGYTKKIWETFLKAAFLPALVAVPLTVGFIMLNAGSMIQMNNGLNAIPIRLLDGVGNFYQLLWLALSLGVMWVGVFTILKGDDILSMGAQSIKGFGESAGKLALKAPLATPIIPGVGGLTPLGLWKQYNPAAISAGISGPRGIPGWLDALKQNKGGDALARQNLANQIHNDTKFHADIKNQINQVINGGGRGKDDPKALVDTLNKAGIATTQKDLVAQLEKLNDDYKRLHGGKEIDGFDSPRMKADFKKAMDEWIKNHP